MKKRKRFRCFSSSYHFYSDSLEKEKYLADTDLSEDEKERITAIFVNWKTGAIWATESGRILADDTFYTLIRGGK